jgi:thiol-disulfide isomerase/thioredoxin
MSSIKILTAPIAAVILFAMPFTALLAAPTATAEALEKDLPMHMPNFRLQDTTGKVHELYKDYSAAKAVVVFIQGNGCPIVRQSFPYMEILKKEYADKDVKFVYINANDFDTPGPIAEEANEFAVTVPILNDKYQVLARALELERTAESFVVDPQTWNILYRGMADDRFDYGLQRSNPQNFWLKEVLDTHLAGKEVSTRSTVAKGCLLDLVDLPEAVDYQTDVAPILEKRLAQIAPCGEAWSALSSAAAREYGDVIQETLLMNRCAENLCGNRNSVDFEKSEARKIMAWLANAAPQA